MINISKRLKAIATYIDNNDIVIDVGCDHCLLDIYLIKKYKDISIIASDIHDGALNQALNNLKKYNAEDLIKIRLGDGLTIADANEYNTIILSGMGAFNIAAILYKDKSKLKHAKKIIVQSNSELFKVRKDVCNLGYYIEDELLVKEKNIIYTIMLFKKGHQKYTKKDIVLGPILSKKNDTLFKEFVKQNINRYNILLGLMPKKYFIKRYNIKQILNILTKKLKSI